MKLAWDVVGYEQLLKQANEMKNCLNVMINDLKIGLCNAVLHLMRKLEKNILQYYKDLYCKKRRPASYLLIFMIANELRNAKPYAVPIQFLSCKSITDEHIRNLEVDIEESMKSNGMVPVGMYKKFMYVYLTTLLEPTSSLKLWSIFNIYRLIGFTTDGEFNSLRSNGKRRPISVVQVIRNAKAKAREIGGKNIMKYFMLDYSGA